MRALVAAAVAIVAGMAVHVSADVDPRVLARPSVRPYTERDGLPQGTIHAIAFDAEGFLWVGTQDGAARFNGRNWKRFDMPDRTVSNFVRAVLPARDGSLWFGREEGGLVRLREGVTTVFDRVEGLPAGRVNHLLETADGGIWAATHGGGVARFTGAGFVPVADGLPDLRVWQLLEGKGSGGDRRLLAACEGGVAELGDGDRWKSLDLGTSLAGVSVNSLLETGEGEDRSLWAGTFGSGLLRLKRGRVTRFGPEGGLSSRFVTSLAAIPGAGGAPVVWAGTRDAGVFRSRGAEFEPVVLGTATREIYSLAGGVGVDAETLWIGTRVSGLLRVQEAPWAALDLASGLPGDQVYCFLEESRPGGREAIWIGTNSGAAVLEDGRVETHGPEAGLPAAQVRSLTSRREGGGGRTVWASVVGSGLHRFDGRRWSAVDAGPSFRSEDASVLLAVDGGKEPSELWVGTEKSGLGRLSKGRWTAFGVAQGLPSESVLSLLSTRGEAARTVWVGTRGGGLAQIVGDRVVAVYDRGSGLPNNNILSLAEVHRPNGRRELWVGTRGGVAWRTLDDPRASWSILSVETSPALPNDNVFFVAPGRDGRVYLGTNRGVARLSPAAGGAVPWEAVTFGTNEGLPSAACNQGSLVDSVGRVWVATNAGAAVLDPGRTHGRSQGPHPLVVERVEVSGSARRAAGELRLSPKERDVAFEFALLAFQGESLVRYRSQLVGWEAVASEWVPSYRREFTNLPPGHYTFRVWGRDADAHVSGPVDVRFEVTQSWWRQPAALVLWTLLATALGLLAIRVRETTLRRRAEELEALVRLRTAELSEARDAAESATESKSRFLAHMAHEVRTPLNAILGYSDLLADELRDRGADDLLADLEKIRRAAGHQLALVTEALDLGKIEAGKAELHLTQFDAARLVREAAEIAWPLVKKGHNRLESDGVDALGTVFSDEGKIRQVLLNLLSNAARFTEKGTIRIEAAHADDMLTIRVRDTGAGMSPEQLQRVFTPYAQASAGTSAVYGGTGLGLVISRGYCELLRGSLEVESEPGKGSTFTVTLPVRLERRGGGR